MADPYLGEIRMFPFNFAPQGWAQCNGQLVPINQNQALFAVLGNTYGGDGRTTFALPNLTGRVPIHIGNNISLGHTGGEETHTLTTQEIPAHTHMVMASSDTASQVSPQGNVWGNLPDNYSSQSNASMSAGSALATGGSMPHLNMQPYTVFNFCIALVGEFPPHN